MKVAELKGALLDYWVARALGYESDINKIKSGDGWCAIEMRRQANLARPDFADDPIDTVCAIAMVPNAIREFPACLLGYKVGCGKVPYRSSWFYPSTLWDHGGPIIEREHIHLSPPTARVHRNGGLNSGWGEAGVWTATTWHKGANGRRALAWDTDSALVAAMRCYVASKFGDEVDDTASAQEAADQQAGHRGTEKN